MNDDDGSDFCWGGFSASSFELTISSSRFLRSTFFFSNQQHKYLEYEKDPSPLSFQENVQKMTLDLLQKFFGTHEVFTTCIRLKPHLTFFFIRRVCVRNVLLGNLGFFFWQLVVKILSFKKSIHFFFLIQKEFGLWQQQFKLKGILWLENIENNSVQKTRHINLIF